MRLELDVGLVQHLWRLSHRSRILARDYAERSLPLPLHSEVSREPIVGE